MFHGRLIYLLRHLFIYLFILEVSISIFTVPWDLSWNDQLILPICFYKTWIDFCITLILQCEGNRSLMCQSVSHTVCSSLIILFVKMAFANSLISSAACESTASKFNVIRPLTKVDYTLDAGDQQIIFLYTLTLEIKCSYPFSYDWSSIVGVVYVTVSLNAEALKLELKICKRV